MPTDRQQLLAQADRALRRDDAAGAAAILRQLLVQTPNDLALLQRLGDALARCAQEGEARSVFRRLAEEYWRSGHRGRALAVLRRAVRLGRPDAATLGLLGQRLLEEGLVADAMGPLTEAAKLAETAGDLAAARTFYGHLADSQPRDLASRRALVRVADKGGSAGAKASARTNLAAAHARAGEHEAAVALIKEALEVDPDRLAALRALPDLIEAMPSVDASLLPEAAGLSGWAAAGWALVRALLLRLPAAEDVARAMGPALDSPENLPPRLRLWLARVHGESRQIEDAVRLLGGLVQAERVDRELAQEISDALAFLVRRAPDSAALRELQQRAAGRAGGRAGTPRRGAPKPAPAASESLAAPETAAPEAATPAPGILPPDVQAKVLEAEAFMRQGLMEQLRLTLERIRPGYEQHPKIAALRERLAGTPAVSAAAAAAAAKSAGRVEEDLILIVEDDEGAGEPMTPDLPVGTAPAAPDLRDIDLQEMEGLIHSAVNPADAEMSYQMALGLVEMDLHEQAAPLLARVLADPSRRVDAVLLLARIRRARGEQERALAEAMAVRNASADAPAPLRAELLALVAELCVELGRLPEAREHLEELKRLQPNHSALVRLAKKTQASNP